MTHASITHCKTRYVGSPVLTNRLIFSQLKYRHVMQMLYPAVCALNP